MALPLKRYKKINFRAKLIHVANSNIGDVVIDTGYSREMFRLKTGKLNVGLHNIVTPIKLSEFRHDLLKPDFVILTHFHIDHIGGLLNYKDVPIICSRECYEHNRNLRGFDKLRSGFINALLPTDIDQRILYIEDFKKEKPFYGFDNVYSYGDFRFVKLDGHAKGQYGVVYKDVFYTGDAYWLAENLQNNIMPSRLTALIHEDFKAYRETLYKLHIIYKGKEFKMVSCHD